RRLSRDRRTRADYAAVRAPVDRRPIQGYHRLVRPRHRRRIAGRVRAASRRRYCRGRCVCSRQTHGEERRVVARRSDVSAPVPPRTRPLPLATPPPHPPATAPVVWAATAAPGLTTLLYGLPAIPAPLNVMVTLSAPATLGVYVAV